MGPFPSGRHNQSMIVTPCRSITFSMARGRSSMLLKRTGRRDGISCSLFARMVVAESLIADARAKGVKVKFDVEGGRYYVLIGLAAPDVRFWG